ncbi:hypothetical protein [Spirosoma areae]
MPQWTTTRQVACSLLFFNALSLNAQSIRNDPDPTRWINYSQTYYKIPVAQAGPIQASLYRVTTVEL